MTEQPRRGRPPKAETVKTERRRKGKLGEYQSRMPVPDVLKDNPDWSLRHVNDVGNKIQEMYDKDWELVKMDGAGAGLDKGSAISHYVGTNKDGSPMLSFLMKKPKEYYDADAAEAQRMIDEKMKPIAAGQVADPQLSGTAYVPNEGIKM